jgi:hypothetical protein
MFFLKIKINIRDYILLQVVETTSFAILVFIYLLSCNNPFVVVVSFVFSYNKSSKNSDEHKLLSLR